MLIKTDKTTHICGWDLFPIPIKGARNKPWVYSSNSCPASPLLQGRASPKLCHVSTALPSLGKPYKSLMAQEKGASRGRGGNESAM